MIEIDKIEKKYNQFNSKVKKKTIELLDDIEYCKTHTYNDIKADDSISKRLTYKQYELYTSMTNEQVEKYLELYYIYEINKDLVEGKEKSLKDVSDKKLNINHDVICNAVKIELQNEEEKKQKASTHSKISYFLIEYSPTLAIAGFVGVAGIFKFIQNIMRIGVSPDIITKYGISGIIILITAFFTYIDIKCFKDCIRDEKAIKKAKELGLYDLIVNLCKSDEELNNYIEEISEERELIL